VARDGTLLAYGASPERSLAMLTASRHARQAGVQQACNRSLGSTYGVAG
jgi:hypothetical protein